VAGAEAEGRRESEAEAEDEWASEAEGVPLTDIRQWHRLGAGGDLKPVTRVVPIMQINTTTRLCGDMIFEARDDHKSGMGVGEWAVMLIPPKRYVF